jgi:aromatic ring-cleaving dioxygenase
MKLHLLQLPLLILSFASFLPFCFSFQLSSSLRPQQQQRQQRQPMSTMGMASDNSSGSPTDNQETQQQHAYTLKERNPYDVHVYYNNDDTPQRDAAMALRETLQQQFPWMRFYPPRGRPIGPHPIPMWEADFGAYENRNQWSTLRDFLEANNPGNLSVLIHPHSTDSDYADHTKHAYWVGAPMELLIQGWER